MYLNGMTLREVVQGWLDERKDKYPNCTIQDDGQADVISIDHIRVLTFKDNSLKSTGNWDDKLTKLFENPYFNASDPLFFDKLTKYFDYLHGYINE